MTVDTEKKNKNKTKGTLGETIRVIIYALILAGIVRVFFFQPFNIPSGSMKSTLLVGDYLFVSKLSYGYSQYSFPFGLITFNGRVFASTPKRGDVAVFKLPANNSTDYIKRVIGLPGDTVQMIDSVLYLNGKAVPRERVDDFIGRDQAGSVRRIKRYRETLPNGVSYLTLDMFDNGPGENTALFRVPEGSYFMMGDNRDNSTDSRIPGGGVGFVPFENFIGRADLIFFSARPDDSSLAFLRLPARIRWGRLFKLVGP